MQHLKMRKIVIVLVMVLVLSSYVSAFSFPFFNFGGESENKGVNTIQKQQVFKKLILNKPRHAEFKISNPLNAPISNLKLSFNNKCGGIRHYRLLMNSTCTKEVKDHYIYKNEYSCWQDPDNKTVCGTRKVIDKTIYKNITYSCWKPVDNLKGLSSHKIKIEVKPQDIIWGKCSDGTYGYKVDWIPQLQLSDKFGKKRLFKMDEWAWWNSTFTKAKNITINNTAGALTDYQLRLNITYDSDMQSDFDDIRFTWYNATSGLEQQIPYWLQEKADSSWAVVWIKIPELPNSNNINTVKMYYGNPSATSESNGEDVFLFFDDFEDGVIDTSKWIEYDSGDYVQESGGVISVSFVYNSWGNGVRSKTSFTRPFVLDIDIYSDKTDGWYMPISYGAPSSSSYYGFSSGSDGYIFSPDGWGSKHFNLQTRLSGTTTNHYGSHTYSSPRWIHEVITFSTTDINYSIVGVGEPEVQVSENTLNYQPIVLAGGWTLDRFDNIAIHEYASPTPTYSFSSSFNNDNSNETNTTNNCSCPSINTDWHINMSQACVLTDCDIGTGNMYLDGAGNLTINGTVKVNHIFNSSDSHIIIIYGSLITSQSISFAGSNVKVLGGTLQIGG